MMLLVAFGSFGVVGKSCSLSMKSVRSKTEADIVGWFLMHAPRLFRFVIGVETKAPEMSLGFQRRKIYAYFPECGIRIPRKSHFFIKTSRTKCEEAVCRLNGCFALQ